MLRIKDEIKFLPRKIKKREKILKKTKEDIDQAVFRFSKFRDFVEESSHFIKGVVADWCINIVGYGKRNLDVYPEPNNYLNCFVDIGKTVFFRTKKNL